MPTDKSLHKIKNETSGEKPEDDIVRNGNETNLEVPVAPPEINPSTETKPPIPEGNIEVAELNKEKPEDDGENFLEEAIDTLKQTLRGKKKKPTQVPQMKDEVTVEIEKIMEQDLKEAYRELTPIQKQEFKMKG
ncbi:hypothetical protein HON22_00380, partial [Candidatus Peregrinibacteria bacterium]|nr:hypothetical protein [Candidatus Peregrinibacteria bacterium]